MLKDTDVHRTVQNEEEREKETVDQSCGHIKPERALPSHEQWQR